MNRLHQTITRKPRLMKILLPKYRRGIANVVTSAIMLSAVSIIGVMLLGWSNSNILEQKNEIEDVFSTQMNKINEDLIFENIWFTNVSSVRHVNVTLSNVGTLGLNVTEIHFNNSTDSSIFYYSDVGIDTLNSFSRNVTYAWSDDEVVNLIVYTNRGNQFTTQEVAP